MRSPQPTALWYIDALGYPIRCDLVACASPHASAADLWVAALRGANRSRQIDAQDGVVDLPWTADAYGIAPLGPGWQAIGHGYARARGRWADICEAWRLAQRGFGPGDLIHRDDDLRSRWLSDAKLGSD